MSLAPDRAQTHVCEQALRDGLVAGDSRYSAPSADVAQLARALHS